MVHSSLLLFKFLLLWPNDIFPVLVTLSQLVKSNKIIKEIQVAFFSYDLWHYKCVILHKSQLWPLTVSWLCYFHAQDESTVREKK